MKLQIERSILNLENKTAEISERIVTKSVEIFLLEKSILVFKPLEDQLEISVHDVQALINHGKKLFGKNKFPILIDMRDSYHHVGKEARELAMSQKNRLAEAALVKHLHQKLIANFFAQLINLRNGYPTKVFNNEVDAINWLKSFL